MTEPKRRAYTAQVVIGIIDVLADVDRATIRKIAEDIECHSDSVRNRIKDLLNRSLVEEAGKLNLPGVKRKPMTYRLHNRLRDPSHERFQQFRGTVWRPDTRSDS